MISRIKHWFSSWLAFALAPLVFAWAMVFPWLRSIKSRAMFWLAFVLAPVLSAGPAVASTQSGTEFQSLYDKVLDYVQGIPGIITAIVILVFGIWRSFFSGAGPLYFMGSVLAAAAIFIIPTVASGMGGAIF